MKKWFKLLGALVFFAGCFMLLGSELGMTGNVISEDIGELTSFLSIIVIFGGLLVMMARKKYRPGMLEMKLSGAGPVKIKPINWALSRANRLAIGPNEKVFVLDAAGLFDYKKEVYEIFKDPNIKRIYVPEDVIDEVKDDRQAMETLYRFKEKIHLVNAKNYGAYKKMATEILHKTFKHQFYEKAKERIENNNPEVIYDERETNELDVIKEELRAKGKSDDDEEVFKKLERSYRVNKGDIDVLGTALYEARKRKNVNILTRDSHISDSLDMIKQKNFGIGKYIRYHDYQVRAA